MTEEQIKEKICKLTGDTIILIEGDIKGAIENYGGDSWPDFLGDYVGDVNSLEMDTPLVFDDELGITVKINGDPNSTAKLYLSMYVEEDNHDEALVSIFRRWSNLLESRAAAGEEVPEKELNAVGDTLELWEEVCHIGKMINKYKKKD